MKKGSKGCWFVLWQKKGRLEAGVHYSKEVTKAGERAFVNPGGGEYALVIPKENVFRSPEAAEAFYASHGNLKWVVVTPKRHNESDLSVHEAWVKRGVRSDTWNNRSTDIVRLKSGEVIDTSSSAMVFDTKKEAMDAAIEHYRSKLEYAEKELKTAKAHRDHMISQLQKLKRK